MGFVFTGYLFTAKQWCEIVFESLQQATTRQDIGALRPPGDAEPPTVAKRLVGDIVGLMPALRAFAQRLARNPVEADDLVQESLVKALTHIRQFAPGTNLKAWLFTIERNTYYTNYNKRQREAVCALDTTSNAHTEPDQDWSLKLKAVEEALQLLPAHQRDALMMVGGAGHSYEEAAEACGCALGTIRSRVNRGRTRLVELLEMDGRGEFLRPEDRRY